MKNNLLNRREFIKLLLAVGASMYSSRLIQSQAGDSQEQTHISTFLPVIMSKNRASNLGKVIHIHSPSVTNWNYDHDDYYGKTQSPGVMGVSQSIVDAMVDRGITELMGFPPSSISDAWLKLIPGYSPGKTVAIKVNFNNSYQSTCSSTTTAIDAIAQPINAVVRGLNMIGVRNQDIIAYDSIRSFSERVYDELTNKNIQIHDYNGCFGYASTWVSNDPEAMVNFSPVGGSPPTVRVSASLINASYLINIPILKGHPLAGVTLGFKNHFGSTNNPAGMHTYVDTTYPQIDQYNALVDLFSNPHIRHKTVLTIGDGIFGSREKHNTPPQPWVTFNNQSPCSLLFSVDPVSIDCVMHDLLKAERGDSQPGTCSSYLKLAQDAGLGIYEAGDPWRQPYGSGYSTIIYRRIEI